MNGTEKNREFLKNIFYESIRAVDPYRAVRENAEDIKHLYHNRTVRRLLVVGFGKASCPMAKAAEDALGDIITAGLIITKYGHCDRRYLSERIRVFEAGHPVPDRNGLIATEKAVALLRNLSRDTLVLVLVSGGGSALFVSPAEGIELEEKRMVTDLLLKAGADIHEINTVRKHLSGVKGGRLAGIAYPAQLITLILSDVIGDSLDIIASGPTAPDTSTFSEAMQVLRRYKLTDVVPRSVIGLIRDGMEGRIPETPKAENIAFERVENRIIGSNRIAVMAAVRMAEEAGLHVEILSLETSGEARDVGTELAKRVRGLRSSGVKEHKEPICLISGGETTVTVRGNGIGGRNMELALSFAIGIDGIDGVTLLSAGTDGNDGPTDAAGAIVDGSSAGRGRALGLAPEACLNNNDSYTFFKRTGDIFITGPTGTNVMDLQIVIIR